MIGLNLNLEIHNFDRRLVYCILPLSTVLKLSNYYFYVIWRFIWCLIMEKLNFYIILLFTQFIREFLIFVWWTICHIVSKKVCQMNHLKSLKVLRVSKWTRAFLILFVPVIWHFSSDTKGKNVLNPYSKRGAKPK